MKTNTRFKGKLYLFFFFWENQELTFRSDFYVVFLLEFFSLVVAVECDSYLFLTLIDESDIPGEFLSNPQNTEIDILVFTFLKF